MDIKPAKQLMDINSLLESDVDIQETLIQHFADIGSRNFCEVMDDYLAAYNSMCPDSQIEKGSPAELLVFAAVSQAAMGAFQAVASSVGIGINDIDVMCAVDPWYKNPNIESIPSPVGFAGLESECKAERDASTTPPL